MAGRRPTRRRLADRDDARPAEIIAALLDHGVEFVVIGGVAAIAHGVQRITRDIDVVIRPTKSNCRRMLEAVSELDAEEFRPSTKRWVAISAKADPDWLLTEPRLLDSSAGGVDICNAMEGTPDWEAASSGAIEVEAFGRRFAVLDKDTLIKSKLAADREKDRADVTELNEL